MERRIDWNGDNDYLIDGRHCSRDIHDLMDTGLGVILFIISQGQAEAIFIMPNLEERRATEGFNFKTRSEETESV